jgi:capsular exopolysaccharide synthesis family protein
MATGLVFLFEYLDDRLKTPEEISAHLALPTLGLVPEVPKMPGSRALISNGVPLNFAEAFRTVRTAVLFSSTETGATRVVVTSTQPGEGKTITTCNLAVGIAQTGLRVLVIDADMRIPTVHALFGVEQEPGLSNLLVGNTVSRDAIHLTSVPNLWVLPAGHLPPNPAELLASRQFRDLLSSSSQHFDWIVIDAPPVLAVTDASIAAHLAHGVVFVVGADMTSRRAAATAVERLEHSNCRFFGAVINRVNVARHPYYYSRYYHKKYASYYAAPSNQPT